MDKRDHRCDFVRRLFAIAVSVGFAGAIASSKWVTEQRLPAEEELGPLLCLVAGLVMVIGSWESYHSHLEKTEKISVFFTDVAIVLLYLLLLLLSQTPILMLWLVPGVFGLYAAWDLQLAFYYPKERAEALAAFARSLSWWVAFLFMSWLAHKVSASPILVAYLVAVGAVLFRVKRMRGLALTLVSILITIAPLLVKLAWQPG